MPRQMVRDHRGRFVRVQEQENELTWALLRSLMHTQPPEFVATCLRAYANSAGRRLVVAPIAGSLALLEHISVDRFEIATYTPPKEF